MSRLSDIYQINVLILYDLQSKFNKHTCENIINEKKYISDHLGKADTLL